MAADAHIWSVWIDRYPTIAQDHPHVSVAASTVVELDVLVVEQSKEIVRVDFVKGIGPGKVTEESPLQQTGVSCSRDPGRGLDRLGPGLLHQTPGTPALSGTRIFSQRPAGTPGPAASAAPEFRLSQGH